MEPNLIRVRNLRPDNIKTYFNELEKKGSKPEQRRETLNIFKNFFNQLGNNEQMITIDDRYIIHKKDLTDVEYKIMAKSAENFMTNAHLDKNESKELLQTIPQQIGTTRSGAPSILIDSNHLTEFD